MDHREYQERCAEAVEKIRSFVEHPYKDSDAPLPFFYLLALDDIRDLLDNALTEE